MVKAWGNLYGKTSKRQKLSALQRKWERRVCCKCIKHEQANNSKSLMLSPRKKKNTFSEVDAQNMQNLGKIQFLHSAQCVKLSSTWLRNSVGHIKGEQRMPWASHMQCQAGFLPSPGREAALSLCSSCTALSCWACTPKRSGQSAQPTSYLVLFLYQVLGSLANSSVWVLLSFIPDDDYINSCLTSALEKSTRYNLIFVSESSKASHSLFTMCSVQLDEPWFNIILLLLIISEKKHVINNWCYLTQVKALVVVCLCQWWQLAIPSPH